MPLGTLDGFVFLLALFFRLGFVFWVLWFYGGERCRSVLLMRQSSMFFCLDAPAFA